MNVMQVERVISDGNLPKYRIKRGRIFGAKFMTRFYRKHPSHREKTSRKLFLAVIEQYNKNMGQAMVDCREGVEFPQRIGLLRMETIPPGTKRRIINRLYNVEGVNITQRRFESDDYGLKIVFRCATKRYNMKLKELWMFKAKFTVRQKASLAFIANWKKYMMSPDWELVKKTKEGYGN